MRILAVITEPEDPRSPRWPANPRTCLPSSDYRFSYYFEYLIVGAYAVTYYAEPRYTKDLDILIRPSLENAKKT